MAFSTIGAIRIAAIATCVPARRFDNLTDTSEFTQDVEKHRGQVSTFNTERS